jgi:hypothetical protein
LADIIALGTTMTGIPAGWAAGIVFAVGSHGRGVPDILNRDFEEAFAGQDERFGWQIAEALLDFLQRSDQRPITDGFLVDDVVDLADRNLHRHPPVGVIPSPSDDKQVRGGFTHHQFSRRYVRKS